MPLHPHERACPLAISAARIHALRPLGLCPSPAARAEVVFLVEMAVAEKEVAEAVIPDEDYSIWRLLLASFLLVRRGTCPPHYLSSDLSRCSPIPTTLSHLRPSFTEHIVAHRDEQNEEERVDSLLADVEKLLERSDPLPSRVLLFVEPSPFTCADEYVSSAPFLALYSGAFSLHHSRMGILHFMNAIPMSWQFGY